MTTTLISKEGFSSLEEVTDWVNNLSGKTWSKNPNFKIEHVIQFQLVEKNGTYGAILLAQVERRQSMSSMVMSMRQDLNLVNEGE
ncbi:MAG: hypothetical protein KDJ65_15785 [Anaerolineae bacterium]|nr:hypothetical protein [Anaerolineae bacterium]